MASKFEEPLSSGLCYMQVLLDRQCTIGELKEAFLQPVSSRLSPAFHFLLDQGLQHKAPSSQTNADYSLIHLLTTMVVPWVKAYIACTFLGFMLCLIPFTWHLAGMSAHTSPYLGVLTGLAARNTGTTLSIAWAGVACLICFVNSIIWADNVVNWSPVWCDICKFCNSKFSSCCVC